MKWLTLFVSSLALGSVLVESQAAQAQTRRQRLEPQRELRDTGVRKLSVLIGAPVALQGDIAAGKIEDVVLNDSGCVDYLVIVHEDKYTLVPWGAAQIDFGRRHVVLEIPQERFREVPTFARDRWPNLTDRVYVEKLYGSYGIRPGQERRIEKKEREERRRER